MTAQEWLTVHDLTSAHLQYAAHDDAPLLDFSLMPFWSVRFCGAWLPAAPAVRDDASKFSSWSMAS